MLFRSVLSVTAVGQKIFSPLVGAAQVAGPPITAAASGTAFGFAAGVLPYTYTADDLIFLTMGALTGAGSTTATVKGYVIYNMDS